MAQLSSILFAIFAFIAVGHGLDFDYYWKDYTGYVPRDAVVGGQDVNGDNIYIGQAYVSGGAGGIIVVQIKANQSEVSIPFYGVKKSRVGVKILCSTNQKQFSWMRSDITRLQSDLIGKVAVTGGVENGIPLYVCRIFNNGEIRIGKVGLFDRPKAKSFFVRGDNEMSSNSFEVLLFNPNVTADAVSVSEMLTENVIPA